MEFLVTMTTRVPEGTTDDAVREMREREAARSRELAARGELVRLWRPPLGPGEWRSVGLFSARDAERLEEVLASMPLRVWRTDQVTPLTPHPSDPAAADAGPATGDGLADSALAGVLDRWKAAFDGHDLDAMAALFTPDALFQGFGPEVLAGREAVRGYYADVADDRRADVTVLHAHTLGQGAAGGFADVVFRDPNGWRAHVHLSLALRRDSSGDWLIRQYHVSRVSAEH